MPWGRSRNPIWRARSHPGPRPGDFYTGEFAERAVAFLRAGGAPFSGDEWAAGAESPAQPLSGRYGQALVHQTPVPSAGWMVLQQAAICDGRVGGTA